MTTETLIREKFTAKQAIQSLITGLNKAIAGTNGYENFNLTMNTYGDASDTVCYGCVATVALQELVGYIFPPETYSNKYADTEDDRCIYSHQRAILNHELAENYTRKDIIAFEEAVNDFRLGRINPLYEYFDEPTPEVNLACIIRDYNIKEELPKIKAFYKEVYS